MNPRGKGLVPKDHADRLRQVAGIVPAAYTERDAAIVAALKAGGSAMEVSKLVGLTVSKLVGLTVSSVIKIGHKGGWPTDEERAAWEQQRRPPPEWSPEMLKAIEELGGK